MEIIGFDIQTAKIITDKKTYTPSDFAEHVAEITDGGYIGFPNSSNQPSWVSDTFYLESNNIKTSGRVMIKPSSQYFVINFNFFGKDYVKEENPKKISAIKSEGLEVCLRWLHSFANGFNKDSEREVTDSGYIYKYSWGHITIGYIPMYETEIGMFEIVFSVRTQ